MYIPGQTSLPPVDRDECRFAQASRQMFESVALPLSQRDPKMHSGGLVVPMLVDAPRLNKPPLIYWLQSASAALFTWGNPLDDAIWMYRVPSALAALVTILATWRLGLKMLDPRAALLAAMLLAVAPMVVWDAHQARADQLLLACTTLCMGALWCVWHARSDRLANWQSGAPASTHASSQLPSALTFWLALAAGIMAKGPVTPLVAGLAIVWLSCTTRSWRWVLGLRPLMGACIVLACVAPWVWAVAQRQGGLAPYATLVWNEFFARGIRGSKEGHFAPPGTHTVLLAALFWPGSLLTLAGFIAAWRRARGEISATSPTPTTSPTRERGHTLTTTPAPPLLARLTRPWRSPWRGRDAEMFLIAWIVPMWVVFELSLAKLPHYTMPMYPAIALLSARAALRLRTGLTPVGLNIWVSLGTVVASIPIVTLVLVFLDPASRARIGPLAGSIIAALCAAGVMLALIVHAHARARAARPAQSLLCASAVSLIALFILFESLAPRLAPGTASARLAATLRAIDPAASRPVGSMLTEDSMVFQTRGQLRRLAMDQIEPWTRASPAGLLIVDPTTAAPPGWRENALSAQSRPAPWPWTAWKILERAR